VVEDAVNAIFRYNFGAVDVDTVGNFRAEFEDVTLGLTIPPDDWIVISVIEDLG